MKNTSSVATIAWVLAVGFSAPALAVKFRLPADPGVLVHDWVVHVDHDPVDHGGVGFECIAYDGSHDFPNCYDQHHGTDFLLAGGFDVMDAGSSPVLAAADGEVIAVVDGNYDHCHIDFQAQGISCDGYPMASNHVVLLHEDGFTSEYHHMMKGSIVVEVGDVVSCGEPLGLIGSSGYSTSPHIHFEVHDPEGDVMDPYAGPYSQPESLWVQQEWAFGLPGYWCEGEEPPPEPEPEPVPDQGVFAEDVVGPDAAKDAASQPEDTGALQDPGQADAVNDDGQVAYDPGAQASADQEPDSQGAMVQDQGGLDPGIGDADPGHGKPGDSSPTEHDGAGGLTAPGVSSVGGCSAGGRAMPWSLPIALFLLGAAVLRGRSKT